MKQPLKYSFESVRIKKPSLTRFSKWLAAGVLWASLTSASFATVLISDNFDSGYTTGSLFGQSSSSDVGFAAGTSFVKNATTGATLSVVSATGAYNLTYNVAGGGTISSGSQAVMLAGSGSSGTLQNVFSRQLSSDISKQTIYMRVVVSEIGDINTATYLRFSLNNSVATSATVPAFGLRANAVSNLWSGNAVASGTAPAFATPTLIVASLNWDPTAYSGLGGYTSISLWENPTAGSLLTPTATATIPLNDTPNPSTYSFTYLNFGVGNISPTQTMAFDSLEYATTWQDVVAVPEPSTYAMLLGGIGMLLGLQRTRKRCA